MKKSGWDAFLRNVILLMIAELWIRRACGIQIRMHNREFLSTVRHCISSNLQIPNVLEEGGHSATSISTSQNRSVASRVLTTGSNGIGAVNLKGSIECTTAPTKDEGFIFGLCDFDCNILHEDIIDEKDRLLAVAGGLGVSNFIVPGSSLESSKAILDLTEKRGGLKLIGSAGVHPYNAARDVFCKDAADQLASMIAMPNCYAVGECGLDYSDGFPDREKQMEWFRFQVSTALRMSKPLYLHSRDAEEDFISVMKEFGFGATSKPAVPSCVHCFTGTTEELEKYLSFGFYIGLTGSIMKVDDQQLLLWLNMITLDRLVIETDAPYMGFKGCRQTETKEKKRTYPNVPAALVKVLERVCHISGWSREEVTMRTTRNALTGFFGLDIEKDTFLSLPHDASCESLSDV